MSSTGVFVPESDVAQSEQREVATLANRERRRLWLWLIVGSGLSLFVSYRLATRALVLGSVEGGWTYSYLYRFDVRWLSTVFRLATICAAALMVQRRLLRNREVLGVVLWLFVGVVVQAQLRQLTPYSLERIFLSDANGYYSVTQHYAPRTLLKDFDRIRPALSVHPRSNMPG